MTFHALISPQGHVEYNAVYVMGGEAVLSKLKVGQWYTVEELHRLADGYWVLVEMDGDLKCVHIQEASFFKESPQSIERNIKKWRYEIQRF